MMLPKHKHSQYCLTAFAETARTADYGQKPDIKAGLLNLAKTITSYLGPVNTLGIRFLWLA